MRAIVKVNKKSAFKQYNGYSFPVVGIGWKTITLGIDGQDVDFGLGEVIIQDLGDVLYDAKQKMQENPDLYSKIFSYCVEHDFLKL